MRSLEGVGATAPSAGSDSSRTFTRFLSSAEAAGNVVIGPAVSRGGEYLAGRPDLDEFSEIHESRDVRYACRLLQIVGDHHDAIFLPQRLQGFLHFQGRD